MKRFLLVSALVLIIFSVTACGTSYSDDKYEEISSYVLENANYIPHTGEVEFFIHETTGISPNTTYFGYYFSGNNEPLFADFYEHNNLGKDVYQDDGGTYFGKPSASKDWYFTKKITENWFYFELHQNLI